MAKKKAKKAKAKTKKKTGSKKKTAARKKTSARKKTTKRKSTKKKTKAKKTKAKRKTTKKKTKTTARKVKKVAKKATKKAKKVTRKVAKTATRKAAKVASQIAGQVKEVASKAETQLQLVGGTAAQPGAARTSTLEVGATAPQFVLPNQRGENISLESLRGKTVVLYFYPKDDTPGCTREACSFRDHLPNFETKNAAIFGVSFDSPESHQKFIEKYGLNFDLLADENKEVAQSYGVYVQKNMYGKTYWGIERSTFVIDPSGKIAAIFRNVRVDGHTEEVMQVLSKVA